MLKRFLSYYKPHKKIFALDMLASLLISVVAIIYPIITRNMINDFIPNGRYKLIIISGVGLVSIYLIRMLLMYFIQYYGHMMGVKMQAQMRSDMFTHLQKLPYKFYDDNETGKIMSRMTNDLMMVSELAHHGPENILISSISIIASFAYLATINWKLALIIFLCIPVMVVVAAKMRLKMKTAFKESRQSLAEINAALESSISGIRVTKAFTNKQEEERKFEIGNLKFLTARKSAYNLMGRFHSFTTFITDMFNVIVLVVGAVFFINNQIDIGDYSAFIVSVGVFLNPVTTLINFMEQFQDGVTGFERFVEILDTEPEKDKPTATPKEDIEGHIEFKNVWSSYDGENTVLKDLSLNIKKGSTFALVGSSGGGKTTVCHLLPRFYPIEKGEILIDGTSVYDITTESLRRNIGIVQQDIYLFNASMRDNILYGRPDASEAEVIEAAKRANIHDFILSLPEGYDTVIGERGVKLSGGQKQRLSIARVFLKNPPILILDEATSALDNVTEILIQQSLDELCRGRTTIVVAHRLSTVKNADEIAVIDNGQITEQGTHNELIKLGGEYAKLYQLQFTR